MNQIFKNKRMFTIYYILSSSILIYLTYTRSTDHISQSNDLLKMQSLVPSFIVLIGNLVLSVLLFIIKENISAIFEINKTKIAYSNARNRVQFFKKNEIVCLEGTIEPQDQSKILYTPITRQKAVAFSYGNPQVSGGIEQIPSTINPAGDSILLNGLLSLDYFPEKTYNPKSINLIHFYEYIKQEKSSTAKVDNLNLGYIINILPTSNSISIHNTVPYITEELFLNNSYKERYIPQGIYCWVIGKWGKNKELLPLKFSGCIFVIEKDYRKNFYEYISQQLKKYISNTVKIGIIVLFIITILASVIFLQGQVEI